MPRQEKSINQSEYASIYERLTGLSTDKSLGDVAYTENMYQGKERGVLESVPGTRILWSLPYSIKTMAVQHCAGLGEFLIVHAGPYLYRISDNQLADIPAPLCEIGEAEAAFAELGSVMFVFAETKILEINKFGACLVTDFSESAGRYVPTTFVNGERHDYEDLLSPYFYESYKADVADDLTYGSPELIYSVIDKEKKRCAVVGISKNHGEKIFIPRYKIIAGVKHLVTEIAPGAFNSEEGITHIITNRGLEKIGCASFMGMPDLYELVLADSVMEIDDYALAMCTNFGKLTFGASLYRIGMAVFAGVGKFSLNYAGSPEMLKIIENAELLSSATVSYYTRREELTLAIPVFTPYSEIIGVSVNGEELVIDSIDKDSKIVLTVESANKIAGAELVIRGAYKREGGIFSSLPEAAPAPQKLILGCTKALIYDGRIFLSGNKAFPGAVFYSDLSPSGEISPLHFSVRSYFLAGEKSAPITALTTVGQALAVFAKVGTSEDNVFLYKASGNGTERRYALTSSLASIAALAATNCFGEAVCAGVKAVGRFRGSGGRCTDFECISTPISHILAEHKPKHLSMTVYESYLVLAADERLYLGDFSERLTFGGSDTYSWYPVFGAGGCKDDYELFVYAEEPYRTLSVKAGYGGLPVPKDSNIMSLVNESGERIYYVQEGDESFRIIKTPFRAGGVENKITALASYNGRLLLATDGGTILTFNTDMVGVPPSHISESESFDAEGYRAEMGNMLHPYFYTFAGHVPSYKLVTTPDICGKYYLRKSTVRDSTKITLKPISGKIELSAIYDSQRVVQLGIMNADVLGFCDACFDNLPLSQTPKPYSIVGGGERGWTQVQFVLSSVGHSPFGLYSLAYRYTLEDSHKTKTN